MVLRSFALTHVGLRRTHNEDSYFGSDDLGLYLVADGMGGHAAGEIASQTAVNAVRDFVSRAERDRDITLPFGADRKRSDTENILLSAIKIANQLICRRAAERPEMNGMGTTLAGIKIHQASASVFNVGDSRVYRIRNQSITQVTTDHSWITEQIQRRMLTEQEARNHRWRNVITRALGNKTSLEVDLETLPLEDKDVLVICTDGLSGQLSDQVILDTIAACQPDLDAACKELISQANAAGGLDNTTVILVEYRSGP